MDGGRDPSPATSRPPPNPALPYREDCWSEGETSALVDAWGERYVELNRGNLRQKHWQEVADAVNSRRGATGRRPPRTDVQCKNRIDTLKKKYKIEKARIGAGASPSAWPFYSRLDALIGPTAPSASSTPASAKKSSASVPLALPLPFHRKGSPLPTATTAVAAAAAAAAAAVRPVEEKKRPAPAPAAALPVDDFFYRRAAAAAAAAEDDDDDDDEEDLEESLSPPSGSSSKSARRAWSSKTAEGGEGDGIRQLAGAIRRFAEIYERVESSKQRQMMELEKQRMEFAKVLEFQRMQLFVDSQVQLEKIKRAKRSDPDNYL